MNTTHDYSTAIAAGTTVSEPATAETLPSSTIPWPNFNIDRTPAIIEWIGVDSKPRYLYHSDPDPSRQVTFEAHFDAASGAAFFKIRAVVGLKAARPDTKTPLFLYIHPDRITSLYYDVPDAVPDFIGGKLGPSPSRFQFSLTRPADMVVPSVSLAPRNKGHGNKLESLKILARETCFNVYWTGAALSQAQIRPLCDAVATRTLKTIDAAADLQGLYGGIGGKVLEGVQLCTPVPKTAPPSYGEIVLSPPGARDSSVGKPSRSSRKRRRGSDSSATGRPDLDATATCKKVFDDMMLQYRHEERVHFSSELEQLKTSLSEGLRQLKSEMLEHVDRRLSDLEGALCTMDNVDEHISQHVSSFEDLIEVKIEDHVIGIRIELEDFVDSEVAYAEDRVSQRVRDASWTVAIDE